jgi:hypothetical protein
MTARVQLGWVDISEVEGEATDDAAAVEEDAQN